MKIGAWRPARARRFARIAGLASLGAAAAMAASLGSVSPARAVSGACAFADGLSGNLAANFGATAASNFESGERITITDQFPQAGMLALRFPNGGAIVAGPQASSIPLVYDVAVASVNSFSLANSGILNLAISCGLIPVSPINPLGAGGLAAAGAATGFAGTQNLNDSLGSNVRSRFFGGDQFAASGQAFQLASAYRASGLGQRADARSKVAPTPEGRMRWSVWFKGTGTWLNDM